MKKKQIATLFTVVLLAVSFIAVGQPGQAQFNQFFEIDRGHSYIEFSVKYMGYAKVRGRFTQFSGLVCYDKDKLTNTSVSLLIQSESISTDLEFRDKDLKSDNWLDASKFPSIVFASKKMNKTKEGFDLV